MSVMDFFNSLPINTQLVWKLAAGSTAVAYFLGGKLGSGTPAPTKPYRSFKAFYPFYLREHSNKTNRLLHILGTSAVVGLSLFQFPHAIPSMLTSLNVGILLADLFRSHNKGLIEFAILLSIFLGLNLFQENSAKEVMLVGYAMAWVGHQFFEGNRPATFIYPAYSLLGDFRMWFEVLTMQRGLSG